MHIIRANTQKIIALALVICLLPTVSLAAVKAGQACQKKGVKISQKSKEFTCLKIGNRLVWKAVPRRNPSTQLPDYRKDSRDNPATESPSTAKPPTPSNDSKNKGDWLEISEWNSPAIFDIRKNQELEFTFVIDSNQEIDNPRLSAMFQVPNTSWEIPAQKISFVASVEAEKTVESRRTYRVRLTLDERQPMGNWQWVLEPITKNNSLLKEIKLSEQQRSFTFVRNYYGEGSVEVAKPLGPTTYRSFKKAEYQMYAWEGKNVAIFTKTDKLSGLVMGRILYALDRAYESYAAITQFKPANYFTYNGKLSIAALEIEEIGCGVGCGYLGATGIELGLPLFNRLYNGVERYDQFDQVLFYELGRNFWDYQNYVKVMTVGGKGNFDTDPFFGVSATGFAVYMRTISVETNKIPMQPIDFMPSNWATYSRELKGLINRQINLSSGTFKEAFLSNKPIDDSPLNNLFMWASVVLYFSEGQSIETYSKNFLKSLKEQKTPGSTAQVVENFVSALSFAAGKSVTDDFYIRMRFGDAKNLP